MRNNAPTLKQRLAAYDLLMKGDTRHLREGDGRLGSKHKRLFRSFVRQTYNNVEFMFYPLKRWPGVTGVSAATFRIWIKRGVLTTYRMYDMPVMCDAEMHALHSIVSRHWDQRSRNQHEISAEFRRDIRDGMSEVRNALEAFKRNQQLSPRQRALLAPSLSKGTTHAPAPEPEEGPDETDADAEGG